MWLERNARHVRYASCAGRVGGTPVRKRTRQSLLLPLLLVSGSTSTHSHPWQLILYPDSRERWWGLRAIVYLACVTEEGCVQARRLDRREERKLHGVRRAPAARTHLRTSALDSGSTHGSCFVRVKTERTERLGDEKYCDGSSVYGSS